MLPIAIMRMAKTAAAAGIVFVGSTPLLTALNGGDVSPDLTAITGLQLGDFVVAIQGHSAGANIAFGAISGWALRADENSDPTNIYTNEANLAVYDKFQSGSLDTSILLAGNGNASHANSGVAFAFRGVNVATPWDVAATIATPGSASTAANPPSNTPVTNGACSVIAACAAAGTISSQFSGTAPADLDAGAGEYRQGYLDETTDVELAVGIKKNISAAFDPAAWAGTATGSYIAWHGILRPA